MICFGSLETPLTQNNGFALLQKITFEFRFLAAKSINRALEAQIVTAVAAPPVETLAISAPQLLLPVNDHSTLQKGTIKRWKQGTVERIVL